MGYDQFQDGPEAWMYRHQSDQERRDALTVETFLASLTPADAKLGLFTFEERKTWGLKHTRKRSTGEEADGA
jgi:hypothetical protein